MKKRHLCTLSNFILCWSLLVFGFAIRVALHDRELPLARGRDEASVGVDESFVERGILLSLDDLAKRSGVASIRQELPGGATQRRQLVLKNVGEELQTRQFQRQIWHQVLSDQQLEQVVKTIISTPEIVHKIPSKKKKEKRKIKNMNI